MFTQHLLNSQVFGQSVAQRRVDLDVVAVRAHATVADQVASILDGEQVLPGRDGSAVVLREDRVETVVERVADLLVPEQPVGLDGTAVVQRRLQVEPPVDVDGEPGSVADALALAYNLLILVAGAVVVGCSVVFSPPSSSEDCFFDPEM